MCVCRLYTEPLQKNAGGHSIVTDVGKNNRNVLFIWRLAAALLAALVISACSPAAGPRGIWATLWSLEVGPDYRRPRAEPPQVFRSQLSPSEAASLADEPWWNVFGDQ